jgi:deoxyxylulose-5-phosphate synthase
LYDYVDSSLKEYVSSLLLENHFKGDIYFYCLEKKFNKQMTINQQLEDNKLLPSQVKEKINEILDNKTDKK